MELNGWLLDLCEDSREGVALWLLGDDGTRRRLTQPFPVGFCAEGPTERLRALAEPIGVPVVHLAGGARGAARRGSA